MSSVKTMACPYGQGKWRNSSNDSKLNYTGTVGSRNRPPLIRLDSTGEMKSTGFISHQHSFDSEIAHFQKSNSSVLNLKNWLVGKVVNTRNNLAALDRNMDTVSFNNNSIRYETMPQTRPFVGQPSGCHNTDRWHPKIPSFSFQQPRFNGDFRIFPCHQFEFYNNIKNNMDMHVMGPLFPQNFVGFPNGPHDQNFRSRNKHVHMPPRKVLKRERDSVPTSQVSNSRQQPSNHSGDSVDSPSKSQKEFSSSQQCTVKEVQNEISCENVQPPVDLELSTLKDKSKEKCNNDVTSTDIIETSGNVTNCTADDARALKGDSDSIAESLIDGFTNIVLNDVHIGKTCLTAEKRKIQEEAHISEVAQSTNDVLLLRRACKKGRPSAKKQRKRRRQRARLCDSAKTNDICDINSKMIQGSNPAQTEKPSKCQKSCKQQFGCSTIAFILGLHSVADTSSDVVDSFSDSGEDSDFCDMDECDIAAAIPQCNLTSVLPQHNKPKPRSADTSSQPDVGDNTAKLDAINSTWNIQISKDITDARETKSLKKVNFNDDHLVTVHQADKWSRKGPWEDYARDRQRFQRRITESEGILSPVLTPQHRAAVFQTHHSSS